MIARYDQVPPAVIYTPSPPKHDWGGEGYALMSWFLNLPYYGGSILGFDSLGLQNVGYTNLEAYHGNMIRLIPA